MSSERCGRFRNTGSQVVRNLLLSESGTEVLCCAEVEYICKLKVEIATFWKREVQAKFTSSAVTSDLALEELKL